MGYSVVKEEQHVLTWYDVWKRQQEWRASLLLVIGAPEEGQLEKQALETYFGEWEFTTMNATACTLQCGWDPDIWNPPSHRMTIHLAEHRYAMVLQLEHKSGAQPPTGDEVFQLILTKLFSGTPQSRCPLILGKGWRLTTNMAAECWRTLIKTVTSSQRWIITGDLAAWQYKSPGDMISEHFRGDEVSKRNVQTVTNENRSLAIVTGGMRLAVARASWTTRSMVIQIHVTQDASGRAWTFNPYVFLSSEPAQGDVQSHAPENESARGSVEPRGSVARNFIMTNLHPSESMTLRDHVCDQLASIFNQDTV